MKRNYVRFSGLYSSKMKWSTSKINMLSQHKSTNNKGVTKMLSSSLLSLFYYRAYEITLLYVCLYVYTLLATSEHLNRSLWNLVCILCHLRNFSRILYKSPHQSSQIVEVITVILLECLNQSLWNWYYISASSCIKVSLAVFFHL
jgi:hypothetical protein